MQQTCTILAFDYWVNNYLYIQFFTKSVNFTRKKHFLSIFQKLSYILTKKIYQKTLVPQMVTLWLHCSKTKSNYGYDFWSLHMNAYRYLTRIDVKINKQYTERWYKRKCTKQQIDNKVRPYSRTKEPYFSLSFSARDKSNNRHL